MDERGEFNSRKVRLLALRKLEKNEPPQSRKGKKTSNPKILLCSTDETLAKTRVDLFHFTAIPVSQNFLASFLHVVENAIASREGESTSARWKKRRKSDQVTLTCSKLPAAQPESEERGHNWSEFWVLHDIEPINYWSELFCE